MRFTGFIFRYFKLLFVALLASSILVACGGSDGESSQNGTSTITDTASANPEPVQRGDWKRTETLTNFSANEIQQSSNIPGPDIPTDTLQYAVKLYRITYTTSDGNGSLVNASGLLALPDKNPQLASPLLSFQHGTIFYDADAPSNDLNSGAPPVLLASLGYITVAADYVGYGTTKGTPHPYLQKENSGDVVIDLIRAVRFWLDQQAIPYNQQLLLTGYSQGGYVTMAAHQALQALQDPTLTVTASVPAAGPYNMEATLDELTSQVGFRQRKQALMETMPAESSIQPTTAQRLAPTLAEPLADFIVDQLVPNDSDIVFSDDVIFAYLRTGGEATREENVHDWQALAPVRLFHGRDDGTVPFLNATDALAAMQARNSQDVMLIECVTPSNVATDHDSCIAPYGLFVAEYFGGIAQGL